MTDLDGVDIHTFFGLSYSNYLVLNRTLLQSMPLSWQHRFTGLMEEFNDAFAEVPQAECFEVTAAREANVDDFSVEELEDRFGITVDPEPPADEAPFQEWDEWRTHRDYWDKNGNPIHGSGRFLEPCNDPVPHYDRGRAYVKPVWRVHCNCGPEADLSS